MKQSINGYRNTSSEKGPWSVERPAPPGGQYPVPVGPMTDIKVERPGEEKVPLSFSATGSGRLVYAKPFVSAPKAIVGGYFDIQYRAHSNGVLEGYGNGVTNGFDQQRFVPFIYADITEHVKFAAEIEIEHSIRGGDVNEVSLEFGHIDYLVNEPFNIRAGIMLIPLGKFNLLHDSPLNDLTDRPLVSQLVIPSTMSETGVGFYGTLYPGRTSKLDYEFYYTTGPCGYEADGTPRVNEENGTKNSRQRKCASDDGLDINNGKAVSGRVAFSPMLGVEVAGSSYYGNAAPTGMSIQPPQYHGPRLDVPTGSLRAYWRSCLGLCERKLACHSRKHDWICSRIFTDRNRRQQRSGYPAATHEWLLHPEQLSFHAGVLDQVFPETVWRRIDVHGCDPVRQGEHQPG